MEKHIIFLLLGIAIGAAIICIFAGIFSYSHRAELDNYRREVRGLEEQITILRDTNNQLTAAVTRARTDLGSARDSITELEERNRNLTQRATELVSRLGEATERIGNLTNNISNLTRTNEQLRARVSERDSILESIRTGIRSDYDTIDSIIEFIRSVANLLPATIN